MPTPLPDDDEVIFAKRSGPKKTRLLSLFNGTELTGYPVLGFTPQR